MNITSLPKHHALLLTTSDRKSLSEKLFTELKAISIANKLFDTTVLDIDTARNIITWSNTPYNEERTAVISFHTVGIEAQNTLLKLLEEPRDGVKFILITTNKANLLATVLSRTLVLENTDNKSTQDDTVALNFLLTNPNVRLKLPEITELLAKTDEEGRKDRESVRMFILSLVRILTQKGIASNYIEETLTAASYASDPSASGKSLLEYLALLLPQIVE